MTSRPIAKLVVRRTNNSGEREKASATLLLPVAKRNELLDRCREGREEADPDATTVEDAEVEIVIEPE